jgi:uncharacterized repeat protein (TIGR03803 family)
MRNSFALPALAILALGLSLPAQAQTYKFRTLYSFRNNVGPAAPASVILDSKGNLYGVSYWGGKYGRGTVFTLSPKGVLTALHSFNGTDGAGPTSLIRDSQGSLYGSTAEAGYPSTVFKMVKGSGGTYTFSTLYTSSDFAPQSVTLDSEGNLDGTDNQDCTCVFKISPSGQWTDLYYTGGQPTYPVGNVLVDKSGAVYASIDYEGIAAFGNVVELSPTSQTFSIPLPAAGSDYLIEDSAGNIYGLGFGNGADTFGAVFKIDTTTGVMTNLYTFTGKTDGKNPGGSFATDSAGNIYGTAQGGKLGDGLVFKLTPQGQQSVLYYFQSYVEYGLVMDSAGNLYGVTGGGGAYGLGSIYKLTRQDDNRRTAGSRPSGAEPLSAIF